jgi:predicted MFS family arabinose efflux permease
MALFAMMAFGLGDIIGGVAQGRLIDKFGF